MKILVIQQKMIGDVITSTVICDNLKQNLKNAEVHFLVNDHTQEVVQHHESIDRLVIFKKAYKKDYFRFYNFLKWIRRQKYDVVIDVYGKIESNITTLASRARLRISYRKWYTSWIYNKLFDYSTKAVSPLGLAIENRLLLLGPILASKVELTGKPRIVLTTPEKTEVVEYLEEHKIDSTRPLIMVSVQGSSDIKSYPPLYMAQFLESVIQHSSATLLFNYAENQEENVMKIYRACSPKVRERIRIDLKPGTLRFFLALLGSCDAMIGNEGGTMNMAKALNIPTFSIFSPWISKVAWNIHNDDPRNMAVHLQDYLPHPFEDKSQSELRGEAKILYQKFRPELFEEKLRDFLSLEGISD